eukprot:jgi/Ulvmu1/3836/UM018_0048.1
MCHRELLQHRTHEDMATRGMHVEQWLLVVWAEPGLATLEACECSQRQQRPLLFLSCHRRSQFASVQALQCCCHSTLLHIITKSALPPSRCADSHQPHGALTASGLHPTAALILQHGCPKCASTKLGQDLARQWEPPSIKPKRLRISAHEGWCPHVCPVHHGRLEHLIASHICHTAHQLARRNLSPDTGTLPYTICPSATARLQLTPFSYPISSG